MNEDKRKGHYWIRSSDGVDDIAHFYRDKVKVLSNEEPISIDTFIKWEQEKQVEVISKITPPKQPIHKRPLTDSMKDGLLKQILFTSNIELSTLAELTIRRANTLEDLENEMLECIGYLHACCVIMDSWSDVLKDGSGL